ncbi:hypothetical protein BDA99DRAFT_514247 [Phascolomyces articulosus]|uniref:Uncharacterized protein n=1 Tax=Phascolomyces articulosus TaxID=60185 RepID=A0AAD5JXC6_9FUNG|nr:hypothetical protein BDA99DRAFT_514247 [Phascolomyces articulosus]
MPKRNYEDQDIKENDSSDETIDIQEKIDQSNKRRKGLQNVFIAYDMEEQMRKQVARKEEKVKKQMKRQQLLSQTIEVIEKDGVYVDGVEVSVGTKIKNAAIQKHSLYQHLDPNCQSIICLGLNSILDLSAKYPERQTVLFNKTQWHDLTKMYPPRQLDGSSYAALGNILKPIFNAYKDRKPNKNNWISMFKEVVSLQSQYNPELEESLRDVDFCLYFYRSLLHLQKHHKYIFNDDVDKSEWDYIVKFWGPLLERLFVGTGLRLKWGDTVLTMKDIGTNGNFKVDMRVLNDAMVQRYSEEGDLMVAEAAKGDPGSFKYQSDRCKLFSESKVIIDNLLLDNHDVDTLYCIQFCGLEMMIMSLSLPVNGLYVGNEVYHVHLDDRLQSYHNYLQTVTQLLCFRDEAVKVCNASDNLKSSKKSKRTSVKGNKYNSATKDKHSILPKSWWVRGTWIPPRQKDSPPPSIPNNLVSH